MLYLLPKKKQNKKTLPSTLHFPLDTAAFSILYQYSSKNIVFTLFSLIPLFLCSLKLSATRLLSSPPHEHSSCQVSSELKAKLPLSPPLPNPSAAPDQVLPETLSSLGFWDHSLSGSPTSLAPLFLSLWLVPSHLLDIKMLQCSRAPSQISSLSMLIP